MALLEILKFPDSRLRLKCKPVDSVTDELRALSQDMLETMYSFRGIGLAAAQVNRQIRLIVVDTRRPEGDDAEARYELGGETELEKSIQQPLVMFNPTLVKKEGKTTYNEGCLSVPSYFEVVERFKIITVDYLDQKGEKKSLVADGLLSICIQHEIDHLDGKLFIDRLSPIKSARVKSKIKKYGYPDPESKENEDSDDDQVTDSSLRL